MEIFEILTKITGTVKMKTYWQKYCLISTSSPLRKELQHPLKFSILLSALCLFSVFRWLQLRGHGICQGILFMLAKQPL